MSTTLDTVQQKAADELIAVTGDKTIQRTWDLADAIVAATPKLDVGVLQRIRKGAVDKAGHDEFWKVNRLKDMGRTAQRWPVPDRIAGVSLDAHKEVYSKTGSIAAARQVILKVKTANNGEATIRQLRAELGANGTTAQPPRIDKAGVDEIWRRLTGMKANLKKHLRGRLKADAAEILAFHAMFTELVAQMNALNPQSPAAPAPVEDTPKAPVQRKTRRKGL